MPARPQHVSSRAAQSLQNYPTRAAGVGVFTQPRPKADMGPSLTETRLSRYDALSSASGEAMRRREFIKVIVGTAAAWPLTARAQQPRPVIGFLSSASPDAYSDRLRAFRQGLKEVG